MTQIEIGKANITQITDDVRVSVVKWSDTEYNTRTYYNAYPNLNPSWQGKDVELVDESHLESPMQVYRYIEDTRWQYRE